MANEFLNKTGLAYLYNRLKQIFTSKDDFDDLVGRVDDIETIGGEPNKIDSISINGTVVSPDANKKVSLTESDPTVPSWAKATNKPTYTANEVGALPSNTFIPSNTGDLTNNGDGTTGSKYATESYVNTNGGKIDVIKVNGTTQTITNKAVDITMPTKVSDLTNDSNFQTATQVTTAISNAVSSAYKYKGSVATVANLPSSGNTVGDVYDVQSNGVNYAWDGTAWDALGQVIDLSTLWAKSELTAITTAEIDTIVDGE